MNDEGNNVCFVISPIGEDNSEYHKKFKEVLDFIIKPAVKDSGYDLNVIGADDIKKPGSWINDILENIYSSFVVVADLTDQNPNVFYELGIRHSLSPRTILIAQSLDDIPSDLRSYRTIVYQMTLKGADKFKKELYEYISQIYQNPNYPDNPVIENYNDITDKQVIDLERENIKLQKQIKKLQTVKKISNEVEDKKKESVRTRLNRIFQIEKFNNILIHPENYGLYRGFPTEEGNFELYYNPGKIPKHFFISKPYVLNIKKELADIRVLMELSSRKFKSRINFVIVVNSDLSSSNKRKTIRQFSEMKKFLKMEYRNLYELELWDNSVLLDKERELGIIID